jgi:hypothetical protein
MNMSEEGSSFWITLAEKFLGLLLIIVSIILIYFTATSTSTLGVFTGLFGFLAAVVLVGGAFMIIVRPPE